MTDSKQLKVFLTHLPRRAILFFKYLGTFTFYVLFPGRQFGAFLEEGNSSLGSSSSPATQYLELN